MISLRHILFALLLLGTVSASAAEIAVLRNGFEIRHERREQAGNCIRLYVDGPPGSGYIDVPSEEIIGFRHDDPPAAEASPAITSRTAGAPDVQQDLQEWISAASDRHQIDPDLISSVIRAESNFDPRARSPKGAQGLMQLMPSTASHLGIHDAFQPEANIDAGTRYLRELLLRYHNDMAKALAAYNAGPQPVAQYGGVPPYRETHAYVARVIRDFNRKKLKESRSSLSAKTTRKARTHRTTAGPHPPAASEGQETPR